MRGLLLMTMETVAGVTPTLFATSLMVMPKRASEAQKIVE